MDEQDFQDWLAAVIEDSIDLGWTSNLAARLIISRLRDNGRLEQVLDAVVGMEE